MKRTILSLACFSILPFCLITVVAAPPDADNTAKNQRDRSGETKTSGDQSNDSTEIKTTASIRRAVMKDGSLSMTAKNVKIITENGMVTLRGPVNTKEEAAKIEKIARSLAGSANIVNQLEIKAK